MGFFSKRKDDTDELNGMERVVIDKLRHFVKSSEYDPRHDYSQITLILQVIGPAEQVNDGKKRREMYTGRGSYPEPGMPVDIEMALDASLATTMMEMVDEIGERVGKFQKDTGISFKEGDNE